MSQPGWPMATGLRHQAAVDSVGQTTRSTTGQRSRALSEAR